MIKKSLLLIFLILSLAGCGGGSSVNSNIKELTGDYLKAYEDFGNATGFEDKKEVVTSNNFINFISGDDTELVFKIDGVEFIHLNTESMDTIAPTDIIFQKDTKLLRKNISFSKDKSALVLLPFHHQWKNVSLRYAESLFSRFKTVKILKDEDVTPEAIKSLFGKYDFIYFQTHGSKKGSLMTGVETKKTVFELELYTTIGSTTSYPKKKFITLKPSFFKNIGAIKAKLVMLNSCDTMRTNNLSDILLEKGVSIVSGWNDTINRYSWHLGDKYFDYLFQQCAPFKDIAETTRQKVLNSPRFPDDIECYHLTSNCVNGKITLPNALSQLVVRTNFNSDNLYLNSSCLAPETEISVSANISFSNLKLEAVFNQDMTNNYHTTGAYSPKSSYWSNPRTFIIDFVSFVPGGTITLKAGGFTSAQGQELANDINFVFPDNTRSPTLSKYSLGGDTANVGDDYTIRFELQDLDGDIEGLEMNWGDSGNFDLDVSTSSTSPFLKSVTHVYGLPGVYTWEAFTRDAHGNKSTIISQSVVVE